MPLVGRANEDGVDLRIAAELLVVGLELDRPWQFGREAAHPILGQVAERDNCATWVAGDRPPIDPSDTHADDRYSYTVHS